MDTVASRTTPRHAWVVWSVALFAYIVAVLDRSSFGVAGLEAASRFGASASTLAGFTVLQLVVYAALQVPVGVLLDRFGPRRMIATGAAVMATGQLMLAFAPSVPLAVAGRALVGAGDAMTFVSVLRVVAAWFPPPRVPLLTQLTGLVGQFGQILSAIPLVALLARRGWTVAFTSVAALGVLAGVLAVLALRDSPAEAVASGPPTTVRRVRADVVSAWRHPGTRLGMWTHFTTGFPGTVFALMWGFPFLVSGEGVPRAQASALMTVFVLVVVATGPVVGVLVERHPLRRSWLVLAIVAVNVSAWTAVLAWPGRAPGWLLAVLVVALAVGGPGSMIGFDYARTFNPSNRLGTATGIVNVGGFVASLVTILLVGVVLDVRGAGGGGGAGGAGGSGGAGTPAALGDYRVAMSVQYLVWALGVAGILVSRRKVRRRMAARGVLVPPLREAIARNRRMRRQRPPQTPDAFSGG